MSRPKKESKILNIKLSMPINDKLEQFCEETGMTKTTATEKIMAQFFEEYFNRPEEDRRIFK